MAEPNQELSFNQYSVLIATINSLREEVRATHAQTSEMLKDHEDRLRRQEVLLIVGFFLVVIVGILSFFLLRG